MNYLLRKVPAARSGHFLVSIYFISAVLWTLSRDVLVTVTMAFFGSKLAVSDRMAFIATCAVLGGPTERFFVILQNRTLGAIPSPECIHLLV